jgi:hypothetical protein
MLAQYELVDDPGNGEGSRTEQGEKKPVHNIDLDGRKL